MADVKISELTALTSPDGAEELVVNDSGTTKKITITNATSASLPKAGGLMTGDTAHGDQVKSTYGNDNDLTIYHQGGYSYIHDSGTGPLYIRATDLILKSGTDNDTYAQFIENGAAELYYSDAKKLATTSTGVDVTGSVNDSSGNVRAGRKNLIINGGFDVWQRGTSFTSIGNAEYCADRFSTSRTHQVNISRVSSGVQGFKYAHRHTNVTTGVGTLYHNIENTGQFYAGQSVTLSFWARASEAIDVRTLRVWDGGSYVTAYDVVNLTTSWQKITTTQVINSNWSGSETTFGVQVWTGDGANMSAGSWIETTGVQLELGSVATDFEHRSYGEELALCQRYFEQNAGNSAWFYSVEKLGAGYGRVNYNFAVTKRATPAMTVTNSQPSNGSVSGAQFVTLNGFSATKQTMTVPAYVNNWTADAEL